jgi:hypothetical protein
MIKQDYEYVKNHHVAINIVKDFYEMTIDYQYNYQFTYWTSLNTLVCMKCILPSSTSVVYWIDLHRFYQIVHFTFSFFFCNMSFSFSIFAIWYKITLNMNNYCLSSYATHEKGKWSHFKGYEYQNFVMFS